MLAGSGSECGTKPDDAVTVKLKIAITSFATFSLVCPLGSSCLSEGAMKCASLNEPEPLQVTHLEAGTTDAGKGLLG